ncbi:MAG: glycosyltransferase [Clostridiales bacterium]|nr:glycosyltransferase [Clostridiales bacterium]
MKAKELVSIIVPVYGVENYLDVCVKSIIDQSYHNIEIILVDDGSKDNCPAMCDKWARKDSRIKVIHKENGGLSDARNVGTNEAKGAYITYVDSDDVIHKEYVEYLYGLIKKYKADISICRLKDCIDVPESEDEKKEEFVYSNVQSIEKMLYQIEFTNSASGKLYSMKFAELLQFPIGKYHEDLMTIYKVLYEAEIIAYGQRELYYYMHHPGSISHSDIFSRSYADLLEAIDGIEDFVEKKCPEIVSSVYSRKFSCYSQVLEVVEESDSDISDMLWNWIKEHRTQIVKNSNVRKKNRMAAALTYFGKVNYLRIYRMFGKRNV